MSEWAKQQACWNGLKGRRLDYDEDFGSCQTLIETVRTAGRDARATKALTEGITAQTEVVNLGAAFWNDVMAWGLAQRKLTPKDQQVLRKCVAMARGIIPSEFESRHAMATLQRLRGLGLDA